MNSLSWLLLDFLIMVAGAQLIIYLSNYGYDAAKHKIKLESQQPLAGLRRFGFLADSDVHSAEEQIFGIAKYLGRIDGYPVEISIECQPASLWGKGWMFNVRVFFAEEGTGTDSEASVLRNKGLSNFFKWNDGVTLTATYAERIVQAGTYMRPNSQRLFAAAQELIAELGKLKLYPTDKAASNYTS